MFNVVTNNPKLLKDSIETISQLIDEGSFKIKPTGIELVATDRAMVAVVDFKLNSSFQTAEDITLPLLEEPFHQS